MQKVYILDTNILLSDPMSIYNFGDNKVVLTESVIEEIDKFKRGNDDRNINARKISRELNKLREKGSLINGIPINNNGILKFEHNQSNISLPWNNNSNDNKILQVAKFFKDKNVPTIIVTKDINMKIKADILEIKAEDYKNKEMEENYTGRQEVYIADTMMNNNILYINDISIVDYNGNAVKKFYPNEYLLIHAIGNNKQTLIGKVSKNGNYIDILKDEYYPYGISGRNVGQKFAIDALMRSAEDVPLVIIEGSSGTGKDFISLACGLEQVFNDKQYRKILITREIETLGKDIGTLPGTEIEKLNPFLRGFVDNLEKLVDSNSKERYKNENELSSKVQYLFDSGTIVAEAISYMRGRSISNQYVIIDEAQNCTISQMTGIITRIGENTKIVILGDSNPNQIDNTYLNEKNNGLTWISNLMKDSPYACKITLQDSESVRSPLVKDIIQRLKK